MILFIFLFAVFFFLVVFYYFILYDIAVHSAWRRQRRSKVNQSSTEAKARGGLFLGMVLGMGIRIG